jgi:hypothetical protein
MYEGRGRLKCLPATEVSASANLWNVILEVLED